MQRRTGTEYVKKIDFVFYHEREIRDAVLDIRESSGKLCERNRNRVSDPTAAIALRNVTPIRFIKIHGRELEWPEDWLRVVDAVYSWCDNDRIIIAKDRYSNEDYRRTCAKLNISKTQYYRMFRDIRRYAALCAVQFGIIKVC